MEKLYQNYLLTPESHCCCFCREIENLKQDRDTEIIKSYKYYYVMENNFPYNAYLSQHHMIFLKRHADVKDMTQEEKDEWWEIYQSYPQEFKQEILNRGESISQKGHFHFHMGVPIETK